MFKFFGFKKNDNGNFATQCPSCKGYVRSDEIECTHCGILVNPRRSRPEMTEKCHKQVISENKAA